MTVGLPSSFSVLHIATARSWRGGEQQVAYLTGELAKKNITQYVLCTEGSPMEIYCRENNISFYTCVKQSSIDISYAWKIRQLCKSKNITLIHTHDSHAHTFAVFAAILGNKCNIVVSRRVDFAVSKGPFSKYKYNHPDVKRIICVSEKIKTLTQPAVEDVEKLVTIHSGIDFSRFKNSVPRKLLHIQYKVPDNARLIGNVAALAPHKDYATFINTVFLLRDKLPDAYFFIIGEGDERAKIESLIKEKNLQVRIILTGFRHDIPEILPELDVMLITSETEGLGTAILDAFACNVPVIATAAGGIPEIVIHEQTGLLASVGDSAGLAEQVMRIFNDDLLKQNLIKGATNHLALFTKEVTASRTLAEYLAVTGAEL